MKPRFETLRISELDTLSELTKSQWVHEAIRTIYRTEFENIKVTFENRFHSDFGQEQAMELIGRLLGELTLIYDEDIYVYSKCEKQEVDSEIQPFNYYYLLDIGIMRAPYNNIT